jgi:hypothetical protein
MKEQSVVEDHLFAFATDYLRCVNGKVVPVLFFNVHHSMKEYWGVEV